LQRQSPRHFPPPKPPSLDETNQFQRSDDEQAELDRLRLELPAGDADFFRTY
jgi:hypothetical protein